MKIIIYGSTIISEAVAAYLLEAGYEIIGHIPSVKPYFPGKMPVPELAMDYESKIPFYDAADVILSVQYDRKLPVSDKHFNLHTGLLPKYGGVNILSHTIINREREQGLTFHRVAKEFDAGEIISKITYPVLLEDDVADLYMKMLHLAGPFTDLCLSYLLEWKGNPTNPTLFKRGDLPKNISQRDRDLITRRLC